MLDEFSDEIHRIVADRQPDAAPLELPDVSDDERAKIRQAVLAFMHIEEMPDAKFLEEHFDAINTLHERVGAMYGLDAPMASDSAAVWRLGDSERWVTLIQEGYEAGQVLEKTAVLVTRPLSPTERAFEEATHVRLTFDFAHKQGESGALRGVRVHHDFGVVENGAFVAYNLEDEYPAEWKDKQLDDCQPTGVSIVLDERLATEAEIRTARNMLYQLAREAA